MGLPHSSSLEPISPLRLLPGPALDSTSQTTGEDWSSLPLQPPKAVSKNVLMEVFNLCPLSSPVTEYVEPPYTMLPSSLLSAEYLLTIIFAVR